VNSDVFDFAGMNNVLTKPVPKERLFSSVRAALAPAHTVLGSAESPAIFKSNDAAILNQLP